MRNILDKIEYIILHSKGRVTSQFQAIADVIGFRFRLYTVPDNLYGVVDSETGEWNGIVRQLIDKRADLVS